MKIELPPKGEITKRLISKGETTDLDLSLYSKSIDQRAKAVTVENRKLASLLLPNNLVAN